MKICNRSKTIIETVFICEECGKNSLDIHEIERCERSHFAARCSHESRTYCINLEGNIYWECQDCGYLGRTLPIDYLRNDTQELKRIYERIQQRIKSGDWR